jgi:hypothetical protein
MKTTFAGNYRRPIKKLPTAELTLRHRQLILLHTYYYKTEPYISQHPKRKFLKNFCFFLSPVTSEAGFQKY